MKYFLRGFTTIEVLGALAIGTMMMLGLSTMIDTALEDTKGQQASLYQEQITKAAAKYIATHYSTYATLVNVSTTTPINLGMLTGDHFLPDGYQPINSYGQSPCVLVRAVDTGRTAEDGITPIYALSALVVTELIPSSTRIPDRIIASVAANSGQGGGFIQVLEPNTAYGAFGSWMLPAVAPTPSLADFQSAKCNATAPSPSFGGGSLVTQLFYDGPGQLSTDFLYRNAVPGRPDLKLNQMNTPLQLAGDAIVKENKPCTTAAGPPTAALAIDDDPNTNETGTLLYCDKKSLNWTRVTAWKKPVADYTSLNLITTDKPGDVRITLNDNRAYTYTGTKWAALAVDQNGNMDVPNMLSASNATVTNNIDADTIYVNTSAETNDINGWMSAGTFTVYDNTNVAGGPCHIPDGVDSRGVPQFINPVGTIVVDSNYLPMVCYSDRTFRYFNGLYTP